MSEIYGIELLVISEKKPDDKGNSWKLRLVQWVVDGQAKSVKLERRNFYVNDSGETRTGKADGFLLKDLESCKPYWNQIMGFMKQPPPVVGPPPKEEPKQPAGTEEPHW